jgi:hypothetical protein
VWTFRARKVKPSYVVIVSVNVVVLVTVPPFVRLKYALQNVVAGPWSDERTERAPVMTAQPVGLGLGLLFGMGSVFACAKSKEAMEKSEAVFMLAVSSCVFGRAYEMC